MFCSNTKYNNVKTFDEAFLELYDCSENRQLYNKNLVLKIIATERPDIFLETIFLI